MEAPQFYQASSLCNAQLGHGGDNFAVEDLLDFSNEDEVVGDGALDAVNGGNDVAVAVTVVDGCNNSSLLAAADVGNRGFNDNGHFNGDLGVPYEDLAELEWLSNFVEESFSSEDLQKLQLISGHHDQARPDHKTNPEPSLITSPARFNPVPGKARSKRSRAAAAPCNWTASRLIALSPPTSPDSDAGDGAPAPATVKKPVRRKEGEAGVGEGRKCVHCATERTPQWRTGPTGPKTLCNACGVRYKSGRLVPEYRPASSPTFVLAKHSNSHRKVMELRRQKEIMQHHHHHHHQEFVHHHHHHHRQNVMFDVTNGDDYLIHNHHHVGPDFRQLI